MGEAHFYYFTCLKLKQIKRLKTDTKSRTDEPCHGPSQLSTRDTCRAVKSALESTLPWFPVKKSRNTEFWCCCACSESAFVYTPCPSNSTSRPIPNTKPCAISTTRCHVLKF